MDSDQPLTIVHLLEPGGGGTMRHVIDLAEAQAAAGNNVHVIYSPLRLEPLFAPQMQALQHITLHELPMRRAPHMSDISNLFKLIKILTRLKLDILHAHSTKAGLLARLVRLFVKVKVIYTPHALITLDPDIPPIKKFCYGSYEKLMAPLTHQMIVLSSYEYEHALELGINRTKLVMGLNGIRPLPVADRKNVRHLLDAQPDDIVIGFVGRLSHQKNPELAIAAFAKACTQTPHLKLAIVGDGELRTVCEALAQNLKINDRIIWLGAADAKDYYAGFDMLLITSRYEGMAYSFIEAIHAGLPVIATRVGGSDSCVIHGQTGMLTDADAIAAAIMLLANDPTIRDAMRFAARAHARHFTVAAMQAVNHQIYLTE